MHVRTPIITMVHGKVIDAEGNPVANRLAAACQARAFHFFAFVGMTNDLGEFEAAVYDEISWQQQDGVFIMLSDEKALGLANRDEAPGLKMMSKEPLVLQLNN